MYVCVHTCISSTYICTDVLYYYDVNMIELIIYYYILDILLLKLSFPLRTLCCRAGCSFYQFYKLISFFLCTILKYAYMFYPHLPYTFETNRKNIFSPQNKNLTCSTCTYRKPDAHIDIPTCVHTSIHTCTYYDTTLTCNTSLASFMKPRK